MLKEILEFNDILLDLKLQFVFLYVFILSESGYEDYWIVSLEENAERKLC